MGEGNSSKKQSTHSYRTETRLGTVKWPHFIRNAWHSSVWAQSQTRNSHIRPFGCSDIKCVFTYTLLLLNYLNLFWLTSIHYSHRISRNIPSKQAHYCECPTFPLLFQAAVSHKFSSSLYMSTIPHGIITEDRNINPLWAIHKISSKCPATRVFQLEG